MLYDLDYPDSPPGTAHNALLLCCIVIFYRYRHCYCAVRPGLPGLPTRYRTQCSIVMLYSYVLSLSSLLLCCTTWTTRTPHQVPHTRFYWYALLLCSIVIINVIVLYDLDYPDSSPGTAHTALSLCGIVMLYHFSRSLYKDYRNAVTVVL